MKIVILSDIHDHLETLQRFLGLPEIAQAAHLILCGDLTRPAVLEACARPGRGLSFCLGNCDAATAPALRRSALGLKAAAWGDHGELALPEGGLAAFTHYPGLARDLAASGDYRAVFYGHSHRAKVELLQVQGRRVLLANPGDLEGRHGDPGGLLWETEDGTWQALHL